MRDAATVLEIIRDPATRTSTLDVPHGNHGKHWRAGCHGKRARPVRRGAGRKRPALRGGTLGAHPTGRVGGGGGGGGKACPAARAPAHPATRCDRPSHTTRGCG